MIKPFEDLPEIQLNANIRAKRLKLIVSPHGIRLSYPPKTTNKVIHHFVQQSYLWLQQTWQAQQLQLMKDKENQKLPALLYLAYQAQPYQIIYQDQPKKYQLDEDNKTIYISNLAAEKYLSAFVIAKAKQILPSQLMQFAEQQHCVVNKIRLATPKTRWGSCSAKQEIMLHAGLLLMPQNYADYVLLHELAHTKVMNHQAEFWQLLDSFLPQSKSIQAQVKKFRLPYWWQPK